MGRRKSEDKDKGGRPTKYDPSYCELLVEHMAQGFSFESFAGTIRVNRDTLFEWTKVHEEFSDAKKVGRQLSLLFWEKTGIEGLWSVTESEGGRGGSSYSKSLNTGVWAFNMKNRFGWKDKIDVQESDPDDNDLEFE